MLLLALALAQAVPANDVSPDALPPPDASGVANPAVTQETLPSTICQPRQPGQQFTWVHDQRPPVSYTDALKRRLFAELHLPGAIDDYELDHLWSIEAGGNPTDPRNLWMERWHGPWNAHDKDRLEDDVHRRICDGTITLQQGGLELTVNWVASYRARFGEAPSAAH